MYAFAKYLICLIQVIHNKTFNQFPFFKLKYFTGDNKVKIKLNLT